MDAKGLILANLLHNPKMWIREIAYSAEAQKRYEAWAKKKQALTYHLKNDLKKLEGTGLNELLVPVDGQQPPLLVQFLADVISLETLTIMCMVSGCIDHWDKTMEYDPYWQDISTKVRKYAPFLELDYDKLSNIIVTAFSDQADA